MNQQVAAPQVQEKNTLRGLLDRDDVKKRFEDMLGKKATGFMSSILSVVNGNTDLRNADINTVIASAAIAASMDLDINPNLGFAYIIPYKIKKTDDQGKTVEVVMAQFQMGYKGFVQLAKRSGQYHKINAIAIKAGQLKKFNPLTEDFEFDFSIDGGETIGYAAYMREMNGFEKLVYWNIGQVRAHQERFSKAKTGPWKTDFDEMAKKTLLKGMISKFGTLSVQMQTAVKYDQAIVSDMDTKQIMYADNPANETTEDVHHTEVASTTAEPTKADPAADSNAGSEFNQNDL